MRRVIIGLLLINGLLLTQCTEDKVAPDPAITDNQSLDLGNKDTTDEEKKIPDNTLSADNARELAIADYEQNYLTSVASFSGWTGSTNDCEPGTLPSEVYTKALQQINYFRRQVGLNDDIVFSTEKNKKCQQGALMLLANNKLDHNPPKSWKCYSEDGDKAAGKANIGLGHRNTKVITAYIEDHNVKSLGHRRWILFSQAAEFGFGSTSSSNVLWVIGDHKKNSVSEELDFISWPPAGYVIDKLVFPTWSFSVPKAKFSESTITIKDANGNISQEQYIPKNGFGDNTIAWIPDIDFPAKGEDSSYEVTIQKVKVNGEYQDFNYQVTVIGY